ncbi:hypothetical protein PhCBS80983_g03357 [Powellomyces hirtus]|uniref:Uncharacterized protein n=1 Tax=Powellomyces hirtus TaxID=109895 RepID=A0A507E2R2_9FUNG|nr:hypothetical protein PhCBS80983_g03357 [Powellomyces hirtus]
MTIQQKSIQNAAFEGNTELVTSLLEINPDAVKSMDEDGRTALHWSTSGKHTSLTSLLLSRGSSPTAIDSTGMTPLHIGCSVGATPLVLLLLPLSTPVLNATTQTGQTALHYAASKNHREIVDALLSAGADPSVKDATGQTPLHRAVTRGWTEVVRRLKEDARCKVNVRDAVGNTPLYLAAEEGHVEIVRYLLQVGADRDVVNKEEKGPADVTIDKTIRDLLSQES